MSFKETKEKVITSMNTKNKDKKSVHNNYKDKDKTFNINSNSKIIIYKTPKTTKKTEEYTQIKFKNVNQ
jgi:hypothetical protein